MPLQIMHNFIQIKIYFKPQENIVKVKCKSLVMHLFLYLFLGLLFGFRLVKIILTHQQYEKDKNKWKSKNLKYHS